MKTYNTPEGYNAHDYQKVVAFLNQIDENGVPNGKKLSDKYDPAAPTTWGACCVWKAKKGQSELSLFKFIPQGYVTTLVGTLDLSGCAALRDLFCGCNKLTGLNASGCARLEELVCGSNNLTELNVSGCARLVALNCHQNKLTKIDVSDCAELEEFYCGLNNLIELKMNKRTKLRLYDTIVKDGVITATER